MTTSRAKGGSAARRSKSISNAYAPGARVEIRGEEWIVRRAQLTSAETTAVEVTGQSELVRDKTAIFLDDLDTIRVLRPEDTEFVTDKSPQYRRSKLYLESLLRQTPPTESKLCVGHLGAMRPADYQLVPAARALKAPRARILIADAVGLGKTIEVGVLLSELIRRGRGRRILVVALKSVLEQFQKELWFRFTLPLVRLDSVGLERVQQQIPANHNPFYRFDRVIISVDTLKKDEKYRRFLEGCHWDAIVIDECQHVAERGSGSRSQRARLARMLADTCDSLILTSATPHDGSAESFASLMNLLDPAAVADAEKFSREDVEALYIRRFKKDVIGQSAGSFSERRLHPHHVTASPAENAVFEALAEAHFSTIHPRLPGQSDSGGDRSVDGRSALFRTLLLKSFLSSPQALSSTLGERFKRQQSKQAKLASERKLSPEQEQAYATDQATLSRLQGLCKQVTPQHNTKLRQLTHLLEPVLASGPSERVVVFSERIPTLEMLQTYLVEHLSLSPEAVRIFHGTLDDVSQQELVRSFASKESPLRVLLASDAASEGINLHHHCHTLIHYDIPWSLITLEQRNGRIDRYGQEHEPQLHYLLSRPANEGLRGDLRVLDVLVEKEKEAHLHLGDVRWLMGLNDPAEEEARVIEGVSRHEPAESIVQPPPKKKQLTLLEQLMAGARMPPSAPPPAAADASASESAKAASTPSILPSDLPEREAPFRLYPDDGSYLRAAFDELVDSQPQGLAEPHRLKLPEWHDNIAGFHLEAPVDLCKRYEYLPPELKRGSKPGELSFTLSADRKRVEQALTEAREKDSWPDIELLWELHPVAAWVNDRVVCHFSRQEAPVLHVDSGLGKDEWVYLFQGVLSNNHSTPVLVDWFGVHTVPRKKPIVTPLRDLATLVGLDKDLVNRKRKLDAEALKGRLDSAVEAATAHMQQLRAKRGKALRPELIEQKKKIENWARQRRAAVEKARAEASANGRKPTPLQEKKWKDLERHTEKVHADRSAWMDRLKTSDQPYLRLAAVIGAG